jgi:hypothetical protein
MSLLFNCPRNPYSSARVRPSIYIEGTAPFTPRRVLFLALDRGTSRLHSVDRWTYCGIGMNSDPSPNSSQGSLLVSPSKTISFKTGG